MDIETKTSTEVQRKHVVNANDLIPTELTKISQN